MRDRLAMVWCALVLAGTVVLGIGANPRYIEELCTGGGYGDSADGGADFEADGDILTDGHMTAASFNGVDPSQLEQVYIEDSDEGQEFPGTDHTADQATNIEEELDAVRHMLSDIGGETNWYDEVPVSLKSAEDSVSNTATGHDHDGVNSRAISLVPGDLSIEGDVEVGDSATDEIKFNGMVSGLGSDTASRLFRHANPQNLIGGGDIEAWPNGVSSSPAFWSLTGGGAVAKESSIVKFGSASAKVTGVTSGQTFLRSSSEPNVSELQGRTFTFGAWLYTSEPSDTKLLVRVDSTTWKTRYAAETDTWHLVTISFTVPEASTIFECILAVDEKTPVVSAYFDGAFLVEGAEDWAFSERPITDHGDQTIYGGTTSLEEDVDGAGHDLLVRGQITAGTSEITVTDSTGYVTSGGIADVLRTINIPVPAWSNPDDSVAIGLVSSDTDGDDPTYSGSYLFFTDEGTGNDWASTTVVVPGDYADGSGEEATLVVYASPQTSVSNLRLECEVLVQTGDSAISTTVYTPTSVTFSSLGMIKECEFDIDAVASVGPGQILVLRIRRGESGACTGTLVVVGTAFRYKATQ